MTAVAFWATHGLWGVLGKSARVSVGLLIAATLLQAPVFDLVVTDTTRLPVRSIDLAWGCFVLSAVPVLVVKARRRELRIPVPARWPLGLVTGYAAIAVLSLLWVWITYGNDSFSESLILGGRLAMVPLLALWITALEPQSMRWIIPIVLAVATLAGLDALWIWLTGAKTVTVAGETITYGVTRSAGPFGHFYSDGTAGQWWASGGAPNVLGFWLAVGASIATAAVCGMASAWLRDDRWRFGLGGLVLLAAALGLLATHSRESWLAATVTCLVLLLLARDRIAPRTRRALWIGIPAALGLIVIIIPSVNSRVLDTITPGTFAFNTGPSARLDAWGDGLAWGLDRFPIGWGVGGVSEHAQRFGHSTAENVFIQSWAELGLIGVGTLIALCVVVLRRAGSQVGSTGVDVMPAVLTCSVFLAFTVHGLFGNTIGDPSVQVLLAIAVGATASLRTRGEDAHVPNT